MADFIFTISPNIVLGSFTATRLGQRVQEYGTKFLVAIDPALEDAGVAKKIETSLKERNVNYIIFDEIPVGCTTDTLKNLMDLARGSKADGIIAVGGGRVLSLAKAACALFYDIDKTVYDYIDGNLPPPKEYLPLVCVPTTNRDNFIFTDRAVITDARSSKARLIKTQSGICRLVLWDPSLQTALSLKLVESMALETLSFAVEGYLSPRSNFFSDMVLEKAVLLLRYAWDGAPSLAVTTPQDVLMAQAGCMASLGAAISSFGAVNLLSIVINARYKVSRALTASIILPYMIDDAVSYKAERLATLSRVLGIAEPDTPQQEAAEELAKYARNKIAKQNAPARLKEISLTLEQLSLAAEDAGDLELINSLERSMTSDDLFELLKKAY